MEAVMTQHIVMTPGVVGGRPRIKGHRIRVIDVVDWCVHGGATVDEYIEQFPQLTRAEVHAALAFYYDNVQMIEDDYVRGREIIERFKRDFPDRVRYPRSEE